MSFEIDGIEMDSTWWPHIIAALPRPLPASAARVDLLWWGDRVASTKSAPPSLRARRPGRSALADRWGWPEHFVREMLNEHDAVHGTPDRDPGPDLADDSPFELPGALTHADVVARAVRWLRGHHACSSAYAELVVMGVPVIPDAIGFRRGWSILVEAKVSRSDFRADLGKAIHRNPDSCPGQERWYLTPPGLLSPHELPRGWGLAEVGLRTVRIRAQADRGEPCPNRRAADLAILAAVARRHEVGAKWDHEAGRFAPVGST